MNATTTTTTKAGQDTVKRSIKGLQYCRTVFGSDVPALFLVTMFQIYISGECSKQDIERAVGLPQSTTGRILQRLGEGRDEGSRPFPGLNLIEYKEDPMDWRSKRVSLTAKGRNFMATYITLMGGEEVEE